MKTFVSKYNNHRVTLRYGIPPEPITGRLVVSGLYAKFENGTLNVSEENEIYQLLLNHPRFNTDFVLLEDNKEDPFKSNRGEVEPEHNIVEMEYGQIGKSLTPKAPLSLNRDHKKILEKMAKDMATEIVKDLAPKMAKEMVEKMMEEKKKDEIDIPKKTSEENIPVGDVVEIPEEALEEGDKLINEEKEKDIEKKDDNKDTKKKEKNEEKEKESN